MDTRRGFLAGLVTAAAGVSFVGKLFSGERRRVPLLQPMRSPEPTIVVVSSNDKKLREFTEWALRDLTRGLDGLRVEFDCEPEYANRGDVVGDVTLDKLVYTVFGMESVCQHEPPDVISHQKTGEPLSLVAHEWNGNHDRWVAGPDGVCSELTMQTAHQAVKPIIAMMREDLESAEKVAIRPLVAIPDGLGAHCASVMNNTAALRGTVAYDLRHKRITGTLDVLYGIQ
jgi:hypothetical protein